MTAETKTGLSATYDEKAFRIRIFSGNNLVGEISAPRVLLLAQDSEIRLGPLDPFTKGPFTDSLQNLEVNATNDFIKVTRPVLEEALTQALKKVDAKAWQGAPNYTGPAAQAYE
jgi:hypothetical protein